jgi:bifunctional non-homologous end joining protein LigD
MPQRRFPRPWRFEPIPGGYRVIDAYQKLSCPRNPSYIVPDMLRSASPRFIKPELPTLVSEPPAGEGWIHEIKYDGYRTLIVIDRGQVRAFTRNGNDWTRAHRRVVDACMARWSSRTDEHGITDFHALRSAIHTAPHRIVLVAFDLLHQPAGAA